LIRRQKQASFLDRIFSSLIDTVLQKSPSEVAVLHGELKEEKIRKILIPFGTSIHTRLATEIAPALADYFQAELCFVVIVDPDTPPVERDRRISEIRRTIQENTGSAKLEVVMAKDVLKGILEQSKDADIVLMGGRTGDFLELLFGRSLSQEITEQVKCPVLWVKEYEEPRSLWKTLLKP
jgi:nucleotide-binding universal stress UspA family protein